MRTTLRERRGSVLIYAAALMMICVLTALSFMKWAADQAYEARYDLARSQAYYIAQRGAIEQGIAFLRSQKLYQLDRPDHALPDGPELAYGEFSGRYESAWVYQQTSLYGLNQNEFVKSGAWDATAIGVVELRQPDGTVSEVRREFTLRSQMRTFANYMYLSDIETALPPDSSGDDVIWFYTGDNLYGRVHSNDYIGLKGTPHFWGPVSTSKEDFLWYPGANPTFEFEPKFSVPEVYFPETAEDIRQAAASQGTFFEDQNGELLTDVFAGPGGWELRQWPAGEGVVPPPDADVIPVAYTPNTILFVNGTAFVHGENVRDRNTVACAGNMYLVDNIMYEDLSLNNLEIDPLSPNILGLVSERNIVISNREVNGRANGGAQGELAPHSSAHIVITAGLVALGQSFTFEHQNDEDVNGNPQPAPWDHGNYLYCPTGGEGPDLRGLIYLRGALAQQRRGYVRRSNCGATGYDKDYDYDFRLQTNPPPLYLAAQDKDGNLFFEVTSSWAENPDQ